MAATKYLSYAGLQYLWSLLKTKFGEKQDVISDLSEIRTNASTGAGLKDKVASDGSGSVCSCRTFPSDIFHSLLRLDTMQSRLSRQCMVHACPSLLLN